MDKKEFSIITGVRQTGKSTLMSQLEAYCKDAEMQTAFFNLEDKALLGEFDASPLNIIHCLHPLLRNTWNFGTSWNCSLI